MNERIMKYKAFMPDTDMKLIDLRRLRFFKNPASIMNHGNYEGGLFEHSLQTAKALVNLTQRLNLPWDRKESPYIVGMFHDLCKCDDYKFDVETNTWKYNEDKTLPGHGDKSVIMLQQYMELTEEEIACIRWHMGAYERDTKMWEYYGKAIEKSPNVLYTHTADMIASRIMGA